MSIERSTCWIILIIRMNMCMRDYLKHIYETTDRVANVRNDIAVTTEDKILTLSTCTSDHDSDLRFLVTGVLLNKDAAE